MINDKFKAFVRAHWRDFFPADKHGGIICPLCGNGSGKNGTGIVEDKSASRHNALHCFSCGFSGDIIELIARSRGWDNKRDFLKIMQFAANKLDVQLNDDQIAECKALQIAAPKRNKFDFTEFFKIAASRITETDYWAKRGLSLETCQHFFCGYLPRWRSQVVSHNIPTSPRFIIPLAKGAYLARDVRPIDQIPESDRRWIKQKTGGAPIFNPGAIDQSEILFCVEGEIDAMSVFEIGCQNVIGLGSISNAKHFITAVSNAKNRPRAVIISLDNESSENVVKARSYIEDHLRDLGVAFLNGTSISGDCKDANDLLIADRQALVDNCKRLSDEASELKPAPPVQLLVHRQLTTRQVFPDCPIDLLIPDYFSFDKRGVRTAEKGEIACLTPIVPTRIIADVKSGAEKIELAFRIRDGYWRSITTDMVNIADASAIVKLAAFGVETFSGAGRLLAFFLALIKALNRSRIPRIVEFDQPGWSPDFKEFILPYTSKHSLGALAERFSQKGEPQVWLDKALEIRNLHSKLPRVCLAAAFTPVLLRIIGSRTFGLFLYGTSGYGKSAAMRFAVSVWGDPNKLTATFDSTINAYEKAASFSNDLPMLIDEKQATAAGDGSKFATIMYKLVTEQSKGRMKRDTSLREINRWRTLILANGETRLFTDSTTKGAFNRVIEIGLRECDRLFPTEADAASIHRFVDNHFGTAGETFIKFLLNDVRAEPDAIRNTFQTAYDRLLTRHNELLPEHLAHVAKLISGDAYATLALFAKPDDDPAAIFEDSFNAISGAILPRLTTRAEIDDARRAWAMLSHAILSHESAFYNDKRDDKVRLSQEIWGKLEMAYAEGGEESVDEKQPIITRAILFPERVAAILKAEGFDAKKIMNDFVDRGWTPRDKDGYPRVRWGGQQRRMVVIDGELLFDKK